MVLPRVMTLKVVQGDIYAGLGQFAPGPKKKTVGHQAPSHARQTFMVRHLW